MKGYAGGNAAFKDANSNSVIATVMCEAKEAKTAKPDSPDLKPTETTLETAAACKSTQTQLN